MIKTYIYVNIIGFLQNIMYLDLIVPIATISY